MDSGVLRKGHLIKPDANPCVFTPKWRKNGVEIRMRKEPVQLLQYQ